MTSTPTVATTPAVRERRLPGRAAGGARSARGRRSWTLTVLMGLLFAYCLLPLVWLVVSATKDQVGLFSSFGLWFADFKFFDNVQRLFDYENGIFFRWLLNTAIYSGLGAFGATCIAAVGAYGLAMFEFRGKRLISALILGAVMIPGTALAVPTYLLFSRVNLVDTPYAVILPALVSPFGLFLLRVYAQDAIPFALVEAARLDGAGEVRIFWSVGLRLLGPGFVTVLLFQLVATWNNYFLPLIVLSDPNLFPVTVGLTQLNSVATSGGGGASAGLYPLVITGALLALLPLVAAFLLLQRYWQSGLGVGGVK
jgi:multiple sugar transport system permease protein